MDSGNTSPNLLSEDEAENITETTTVGNRNRLNEKGKRAKILSQEEYNQILQYKIRLIQHYYRSCFFNSNSLTKFLVQNPLLMRSKEKRSLKDPEPLIMQTMGLKELGQKVKPCPRFRKTRKTKDKVLLFSSNLY